DQRRDVQVGDRALGVEEDDDERLAVLERVEAAGAAVDVREGEGGEGRAGGRGRGRLGPRRGEPHGGQQEWERSVHDRSPRGLGTTARARCPSGYPTPGGNAIAYPATGGRVLVNPSPTPPLRREG